MDSLILIGPFVFIGLIIGLIFLFYWIPKKMGYAKVGKSLANIAGILFAILLFCTVFEDQLFFKKDVRKFLVEQDIYLTHNFKIIDNKSMFAIGDYYHTFNLEITSKDKQLIRPVID